MNSEEVYVVFCDEKLPKFLPTKGTKNAAGFDIMTPIDFSIGSGEQLKIPTNFKLIIPDGWYGQILSRSGLCVKYNIVVQAGTIDSDYRGEVAVILYMNPTISNNNKSTKEERVSFKVGERIAQIIFMPHLSNKELIPAEANTLEKNKTQRGEGGFGSTGK
jgi:dUTP pyrophosphatase